MYYAYARGLGDKDPVHHLEIYNYVVTKILDYLTIQYHDYQGRQVLDYLTCSMPTNLVV